MKLIIIVKYSNGDYLGIHLDPNYIVKVLKLLRRNAYINVFTSITLDYRFNELYISTDGGRCCRPIAIVEDNKLLLNKEHVEGLKTGKYNWNNQFQVLVQKKINLIIIIAITVVLHKKIF